MYAKIHPIIFYNLHTLILSSPASWHQKTTPKRHTTIQNQSTGSKVTIVYLPGTADNQQLMPSMIVIICFTLGREVSLSWKTGTTPRIGPDMGKIWDTGVYILSLNFKIAPSHAECALKIFIFAPICALHVNAIF